jgi:hypothetical protein
MQSSISSSKQRSNQTEHRIADDTGITTRSYDDTIGGSTDPFLHADTIGGSTGPPPFLPTGKKSSGPSLN